MVAKLGLSHYEKKVLEKRVLRRIFETRRDEIIGSWRKFHNEELHHLSLSSNIMKMFK
jgi:hypothetical protein